MQALRAVYLGNIRYINSFKFQMKLLYFKIFLYGELDLKAVNATTQDLFFSNTQENYVSLY
jgi:hypothetical protein